jgi:hypothetical protein
MAKETRWVIVGENGLYTGQWLTRREAVIAHSALMRSIDDPELSQHAWTLSTAHREVWNRLRRQGDRAVKATITY